MSGFATQWATTTASNTVSYTYAWASWTTGNEWTAWTSDSTASVTYYDVTPSAGVRAETEAEREARIARAEAKQRDRLAANVRGLALLASLVDEPERARLERDGRVRVRGSRGHLFALDKKKPEHLYRLSDAGKPTRVHGVCQTGRSYCDGDRLAAVALALLADEDAVLSEAVDHGEWTQQRERELGWADAA